MMDEIAIDVENISKKFRVYIDKGHTLKEKILFKKRRNYESREVLRGISFQVKKGEAVGLIGHNGCGKSTTLKLLSKIMYPDSGEIRMKGRVSSLIELGAGFHPDMSGRENIYINASIFGLGKKEIERRLEDIIAFSELEEFIDNPVRTYSSGMYMRLAFAVAINVDADILLIDEILAVGDAGFQAKCFNHLKKIKARGTTIVIVSHSMGQIEQICERSIWLHEGQIKEEGIPRIVDPKYMAYMSERGRKEIRKEAGNTHPIESAEDKADDGKKPDEEGQKAESASETEQVNAKRWGSKEVVMDKVAVLNARGEEIEVCCNDVPLCIRIDYTAKERLDDVVFGIAIYRNDQTYIYGTNTLIDYSTPSTLEGKGHVDLKIESMPVNAGVYTIDLAFHKPDGFNYDFWREACRIEIQNPKSEVGIVSLPHEWIINGRNG